MDLGREVRTLRQCWVTAAVSFTLLCLPISGGATASNDWQLQLAKAEALVNLRRYAESEREFVSCYRMLSKNDLPQTRVLVLTNWGEALYQQCKYEEAIAVLNAALEVRQNFLVKKDRFLVKACYLLGCSYGAVKQFDKADMALHCAYTVDKQLAFREESMGERSKDSSIQSLGNGIDEGRSIESYEQMVVDAVTTKSTVQLERLLPKLAQAYAERYRCKVPIPERLWQSANIDARDKRWLQVKVAKALLPYGDELRKQSEGLLRKALAVPCEASIRTEALCWLAMSLHYQCQYQTAGRMYEEALSEMRKHESVPGLAWVLHFYGDCCADSGGYLKAASLYRERLSLPQTETSPDSKVTLMHLAATYRHLKQYKQAESLFRNLIDSLRHSIGDNNDLLMRTLEQHCKLLAEVGDHNGARKELEESDFLRRAAKLKESIGSSSNTGQNEVLIERIVSHIVGGNLKQAADLQRRLLEQCRHSKKHSQYLLFVKALTARYLESGRQLMADASYRPSATFRLYAAAYELRARTFGDHTLETAEALHCMAQASEASRQYRKAEQLCRMVIAIREARSGTDSLHLAAPLGDLGRCCMMQGKFAEAEKLFKRSLAIQEIHNWQPNVFNVWELASMANMYLYQKRLEEALTAFKEAEVLSEKLEGGVGVICPLLDQIGNVCLQLRQIADAERYIGRARTVGAGDKKLQAITLLSLADLHAALHRPDAEALYRDALKCREREFATRLPHYVAEALDHYARFLETRNSISESKSLRFKGKSMANRVVSSVSPDDETAIERCIEAFHPALQFMLSRRCQLTVGVKK